MIKLPQELTTALEQYKDQMYRDGLEMGLDVAEQIINWLRREPDTDRQRETREWAEKLVAKTRADAGVECSLMDLETYRTAFRNLMARIDKDGGHAQTGDAKADGERGEMIVVKLRAEIDELRELIMDSAPLTWAATSDMDGAKAWERRAAKVCRLDEYRTKGSDPSTDR